MQMMRYLLGGLFAIFSLQFASADTVHFKITEKILATLTLQNWQTEQIQALKPLLSKTFKSQEQFVQALKNLKIPIVKAQDVQTLLEHAKIKNLIASAQKLSGNLKEGKLVFSQNVEGWIPRESVEFFADKMSLLSTDKKNYELLIAEHNVMFRQQDRYLYANRITYDRVKRKIELRGQVRIEDQSLRLFAERADIDIENKRMTLWSKSQNKEDRVLVQIHHQIAEEVLETPIRDYTDLEQAPILVKAQQIDLDEIAQTIALAGQAELERPLENMVFTAQTIRAKLEDQQQLKEVFAEREVCMRQIGRVAQAGQAYFNAQNKFIRLQNGAKVQESGRYLQGENLFLFSDFQQGEVRGNQQNPVEIEVPLEDSEDQVETVNCQF